MTTNQRPEIANELITIGFDISLSGFSQLLEAIDIMMEDPSIKITVLYHEVAKRHNTTYSRVERNIRHAVTQFYNESYDVPKYLLPTHGDDTKLNNREFLHRMTHEYRMIFGNRVKII